MPEHTKSVALDHPKGILHPEIGQNFIILPKGALVGGVVTEQSGVYMSDEFVINLATYIQSLEDSLDILIKEKEKEDKFLISLDN